MKNYFQIFLLLFSFFCFGQKDTNWYAFYNQDSTKIGFKDAKGHIKIKAKLEPHLTEQIFRNVIVVSEQVSEKKLKNYYLNKEGKEFGIDSIYMFDFEYAKEYEGKIKFSDSKTEKIGFFDINGKVVIPAIYNDAGDFHNGIAMIMKDGVRKCWKEDNGFQSKYPDCEHWSWEGKTMMINSKNLELFEIPEQNFIRNIDYNDIYKNFKLNKNVDSDFYISYKGNDGNVYSYYCPEKDFKKWFETKFLPDFKTNGKIREKYFDQNILLQRNEKSKNINKIVFLDKYNKKINTLFKEYLESKFDIDFFDKNMFHEENRNLSIDLRLSSKPENKNLKSVLRFHQESIVFKKIGDSFYITSTP